MPYLHFTVPQDMPPTPIKALLRRTFGCSASLLRQAQACPAGILLEGAAVPPWHTASSGQTLSILLPEDPPSGIVPVAFPLSIPFEDEHLLIVEKPPLVPVHPGPNHHQDTLGNYITAHYQAHGERHLFRPVNRLDRGTSGLMAVAKHGYAQERLKGQLHTGDFRRVYLALCDGVPSPAQGTISAPIARQEGSILKREVSPSGAAAVTHYQTLSTWQGRSLVRLELETGRTHQIRVHMAALGTPLTGDFLYGQENPALIRRAALHSAALSLLHPVTGQFLSFLSPLPPDMSVLAGNSPKEL